VPRLAVVREQIAALEQEDAWRPSRERESLIGERTRVVNRMKAALVRLGIRGFKPELRKAPERLGTLRTPEGVPIPPNMLAEIPWAAGAADLAQPPETLARFCATVRENGIAACRRAIRERVAAEGGEGRMAEGKVLWCEPD